MGGSGPDGRPLADVDNPRQNPCIDLSVGGQGRKAGYRYLRWMADPRPSL